ncbi:flagellar biosynthetic protein FliQ (plasmid) [Vibrio breoganii]|uniref:Flagellar biosynthetic protein FliQ n=2 Tax=Vibrio TaxID=662 RepID=A0AAN1CU53_9VIBR|nr:flagellar biosynthetic protein FliQ [Vibrio breoganii]ANO35285.1 flagellar biosynthetic protein FliQ [Vibrio breoganii]
MTPELAVHLISSSLWVVVKVVCLIILPSLSVGLLVAIFQAVTQIQENTLSFLPRLLAILGAIAFGGHYISTEVLDLFGYTFSHINDISLR